MREVPKEDAEYIELFIREHMAGTLEYYTDIHLLPMDYMVTAAYNFYHNHVREIFYNDGQNTNLPPFEIIKNELPALFHGMLIMHTLLAKR